MSDAAPIPDTRAEVEALLVRACEDIAAGRPNPSAMLQENAEYAPRGTAAFVEECCYLISNLVPTLAAVKAERDEARANSEQFYAYVHEDLLPGRDELIARAEAELARTREALAGIMAYVPESGATIRAGYGAAAKRARAALRDREALSEATDA